MEFGTIGARKRSASYGYLLTSFAMRSKHCSGLERLSHSPKGPERTGAVCFTRGPHTGIVLKMALLVTSLWQTDASAFGDFGQLTHDAGKEFRMISFLWEDFRILRVKSD